MKKFKDAWKFSPKWARCLFWILLFLGLGFIIVSFFMPPTGVIDPSVLTAFGELQGFASLGVGFECIFEGMDVKLQKGDTEITINKSNN